MFALIQSKNHASSKGKTVGRYQFDTHPTGIGLRHGFRSESEQPDWNRVNTWKAPHFIWQSECFPKPEVRIFFSLLSQEKKPPSEQMSYYVVFLKLYPFSFWHLSCNMYSNFVMFVPHFLLSSEEWHVESRNWAVKITFCLGQKVLMLLKW